MKMKDDLVFTDKSGIYADSVTIAEKLEVRHSDLLRTIEDLLKKFDSSHQRSEIVKNERSGAIFKKSTFINKRGRKYPMWCMNEQGFSSLVMQLGKYKKAFEIQDMFIKAFFRMKEALLNHQNASWISTRKKGKAVRLLETDVIKDFVDYATSQGSKSAKMYYMNITKMTNKALELLIQVDGKTPLRDLANVTELGFIAVVDDRAKKALQEGMRRELPYKEIYQFAKGQVNTLVEALDFKTSLLNS